jgi:hypothetical protein
MSFPAIVAKKIQIRDSNHNSLLNHSWISVLDQLVCVAELAQFARVCPTKNINITKIIAKILTLFDLFRCAMILSSFCIIFIVFLRE